MLNYFQKLSPDTPKVASASSGLTSRETEEVSKELKKMQDKGKKGKSIVCGHDDKDLKLANMLQKMKIPAQFDSCLQIICV